MRIRTTKIIIALFALVLPGLLLAWPWSQDMMNQPSIKPQEGPMIVFPQRSVPVTGIPTTVADRESADGMQNPIAVSEKSLKKGRDLFKIYCAACHGLDGMAQTPAGELLGAIPLVDEYVQQELSEGWIWGTITFGSFVMPAYGVPNAEGGSNDLDVEERWHVVNYVKNQLAKEAATSVANVK